MLINFILYVGNVLLVYIECFILITPANIKNIMEKSQVQSIFDTVEEHSDSPLIFAWSSDKGLLSLSSEMLIDDKLITIKENPNRYCSHRYVLTLSTLIKYKVRFLISMNREQNKQ